MKHLYTAFLCACAVTMMASAKPTDINPKKVTDWKSIGICEYTEDVLTYISKGKPQTYEVKVEESESNPGFYRIVNPYGKGTYYYNKLAPYVLDESRDHYLYINAMDPNAVFIRTSDILMAEEGDDYGDTSLMIFSKGYYNGVIDEYGYSSLAEQAELGHMGKLEDGHIRFAPGEVQLSIGDYRYYNYDSNLSGAFDLALPGAKDYTIHNFHASTYCAGHDMISISWDLGSHVEQAYFDWVTGPVTEEVVADVIANGTACREDLGDGDYYTIQYCGVPVKALKETENTKYTAVLVTFDDKNNRKGVYTTEFYKVLDEDGLWTSVGKAKFTDGILATVYGDKTPKTYEVEVEKNNAKPTLLRLVNPFGEAHPLYNATGAHAHNHYLFVDTTDPDAVVLLESPVGAKFGNVGEARVSSKAAQGLWNNTMTMQQIKSKKLGGTLKDNKITFPKNTLLVSELDYIAGNWRAADSRGKTVIELPDLSGIADIAVDAESADAVYYNLQGVEVANPENGLYIRVAGGKVSKVLVK